MYVDHTVTMYEATVYKAFHAKYTTWFRCISILYGRVGVATLLWPTLLCPSDYDPVTADITWSTGGCGYLLGLLLLTMLSVAAIASPRWGTHLYVQSVASPFSPTRLHPAAVSIPVMPAPR